MSLIPTVQEKAKDFNFRCMPYFQILGVSKCGVRGPLHMCKSGRHRQPAQSSSGEEGAQVQL